MKIILMACAIAATSYAVDALAGICNRFDDKKSTAYDVKAGKVTIPWRTDYPGAVGVNRYRWEAIDFESDWKAYIEAVLADVKDSGVTISNGKVHLPSSASWWIAPWMDFGNSGREPRNGLTKERGPDPGDLSPTSPGDYEVWAVGWYNSEGAYGLGRVFQDPCNPALPAHTEPGWTFPDKTMSFKLLFTNADLDYISDAPYVNAVIKKGGGDVQLKLIQVDIAVKDPDAKETSWVMGTFVWKGPKQGDGLFSNLVPVGLMWGNDPGVSNPIWSQPAQITQSRTNPDLTGILWQGHAGGWPNRPYPGFQGRLNGPADNLRSSCLSCHALAQWPRGKLGITPRYPVDLTKPDPPLSASEIESTVSKYFTNTPGGKLVDPTENSQPLDYSLQLEASLVRMCEACKSGAMKGPTPQLCRIADKKAKPECGGAAATLFFRRLTAPFRDQEVDQPPRQ